MKNFIKYLIIIFSIGIPLGLLSSYFLEKHFNQPVSEKKPAPSVQIPINPGSCNRTQMYEMNPEFIRSISLIQQRLAEKEISYDFIEKYKNCFTIEYTKMEDYKNAEFIGDSTPNQLIIHVNKTLKASDDILISLLLFHEMSHAKQFVSSFNNESDIYYSCVDSEASAFAMEYIYFTTLNNEERISVTSRLGNLKSRFFYDFLKQSIPISNKSIAKCSSEYNDKKETTSCYT